MKRFFVFLLLSLSISVVSFSQATSEQNVFAGNNLYATVKKFVSLGEHRTGTPTDFQTSEWLGKELSSAGYTVKYFEFPLKQFFFESASVVDEKKNTYKAFPLWYVSDSIKLDVSGVFTADASDLAAVKNKVVLINFSFGAGGESGILKKLQALVDAGASSIVGYAENEAGQIVAFNAPKAATPWKIPIVIVSPLDAKNLQTREGQNIRVSIKGTFKNVTARNVYGTIGTGEQYVVVSTPISGWFNCGGERGPGIAAWLALAKWAAAEKLPYTFVFTGNSGHELGGWGAKAFLESGAPAPDKTKLWVHLGAGIATLSYQSTPSGLVKENKVDPKRNFFYSASVKEAFDPAFKDVPGNKWEIKQRAGGELVYVIEKGYPNVAGAAYSHPYFHAKADDASTTSPAILEAVALAFKNFIADAIQD